MLLIKRNNLTFPSRLNQPEEPMLQVPGGRKPTWRRGVSVAQDTVSLCLLSGMSKLPTAAPKVGEISHEEGLVTVPLICIESVSLPGFPGQKWSR